MAKLKDLKIDSITNANNVEIPFVIVFTYLEDYANTFVKQDKLWKQFEKSYLNDRPKEEYHLIEDIKVDKEDEKEPFIKNDVAIITKNSLSAISEKDKATLEFGIRVVDEQENIARVFSDDMLEYFQLGDINKGIVFDDVEATLNDVMKQTKLLNAAESQQQETHKIHEENSSNEVADNQQSSQSEKQISEYETFNSEDTTSDKESQESKKVEDTNKSVDKTENDKQQETNRTPIQDVPSTTPEDNAEVIRQNKSHAFTLEHKEPETPLEFAQADLYYEIARKIPEIHLPQINYIPDETVNNIADSKSYDKILTIKRLTEEKLEKRSNSIENYLQNLRQDAILKVYNKLSRRLNVENDELLRKSDFTSQYSPFSENYQSLQSHYQKIIDSLPDTKHGEVEKNRKNHEISKKAYVDRAAKLAEEEYDRNNLHLIEENAQNYINDIKSEADTQYNDNYKGLEKDSNNWYVQNFNTLVPKIVQASKDEIEQVSDNIVEKMQDNINELNAKMESDYDDFVNRMKDITEKEIATDENNEMLIEKRVHERTSEYPTLNNQIKELQESIEELDKKNREAYDLAENNRRDYYAEKKRNEALQTSIDNRDLDVKAANDRYHHLTNMIADGKVDKLQKLLDKDKVSPVKDSFLDKIKNFTNVIAAGILALAIIIGAIIFGSMQANSNEGQVSQSDVKSEVQQAVNDSNKQHAEEQKKSDEEVEQLKKDLESEKSKNKEDKKDDK